MVERIKKVTERIEKEVDIEKMRHAIKPAKFLEIRDTVEKYRLKAKECRCMDTDIGLKGEPDEYYLHKNEIDLIKQADTYQCFYNFVVRVLELDNLELKKQMGKDWDEGLLDVEPDIESVINAMSYILEIKVMVEEILWNAQGNLIKSSLEGICK